MRADSRGFAIHYTVDGDGTPLVLAGESRKIFDGIGPLNIDEEG